MRGILWSLASKCVPAGRICICICLEAPPAWDNFIIKNGLKTHNRATPLLGISGAIFVSFIGNQNWEESSSCPFCEARLCPSRRGSTLRGWSAAEPVGLPSGNEPLGPGCVLLASPPGILVKVGSLATKDRQVPPASMFLPILVCVSTLVLFSRDSF